MGSCNPKVDLASGLNKAIRRSLRMSKVGKYSKCVIKLLQDPIPSGKKLFEYPFVLHFISRKTLDKKGLRLGGSFSLR